MRNKRTVVSVQRIVDRKKLFPIRYPLSANQAFTLIELMIAASLIGLIGLAILVTFAGGFRVYDRVQSYGATQAEVFLSLEEMEKNLRNTFPLSTIGFEGGSQRIAFPAVIETLKTVEDEQFAVPSVGKFVYYLDDGDEETKTLKSEQQNYSQAGGQVTTSGEEQTLASVKDVKFSYYSLDEAGQKNIWKDAWSKEEEDLPKAVKIELTFNDGSRDVVLVRAVWIPTVREIKEGAQDEGEGGGNGQ